jgi:hypothetical protein
MDSRFMKYLTVKYGYVYLAENPLLALLTDIINATEKGNMSFDFILDYYSGGDYSIIFKSTD